MLQKSPVVNRWRKRTDTSSFAVYERRKTNEDRWPMADTGVSFGMLGEPTGNNICSYYTQRLQTLEPFHPQACSPAPDSLLSDIHRLEGKDAYQVDSFDPKKGNWSARI